jgi:hypothetical protein
MSAPSHKKGCTTSICVRGCTVEAARQLLLTGNKRKQLDNGEKKENKKRGKNEVKDDEDGEEQEEEQEEEQGSGDEEEDQILEQEEEEAEAVPPVDDIDSSTLNSGTLHMQLQLQLTQQLTLTGPGQCCQALQRPAGTTRLASMKLEGQARTPLQCAKHITRYGATCIWPVSLTMGHIPCNFWSR